VFINRSDSALLNRSWLLAMTAAAPIWVALYLLQRPPLNVSWPLHAPLTFLLLVMLYPLLEEIVFRGLIQGELMRKPLLRRAHFGISRANLLTSLLFTVAHLLNHPPLMAMLVFAPSLLFGYFRDRHDGWLTPSILLHSWYNCGYFLIFAPVLPAP